MKKEIYRTFMRDILAREGLEDTNQGVLVKYSRQYETQLKTAFQNYLKSRNEPEMVFLKKLKELSEIELVSEDSFKSLLKDCRRGLHSYIDKLSAYETKFFGDDLFYGYADEYVEYLKDGLKNVLDLRLTYRNLRTEGTYIDSYYRDKIKSKLGVNSFRINGMNTLKYVIPDKAELTYKFRIGYMKNSQDEMETMLIELMNMKSMKGDPVTFAFCSKEQYSCRPNTLLISIPIDYQSIGVDLNSIDKFMPGMK